MKRLVLLVAILSLSHCGGNTPTTPTPPPVYNDAVFAGAGDIALCSALGPAEATAKLLDGIPGTVFTLGDNVQKDGTQEEFRDCYNPTWGRHRARTYPSVGNHDYGTAGAAPYFAYFGFVAAPGTGYYSYTLGSWRLFVLNSNIDIGTGSAQLSWLTEQLSQAPEPCTLAYWHHPMFTSGPNGANPGMFPLWNVLYTYHVDVVMNGHDHLYERFAPQDPYGRADPARGVRQFTAGSGGAPLYPVVAVAANSEVRASVHGVLKLTLRSGTYDWEFVPVAGQTFRDTGSTACH